MKSINLLPSRQKEVLQNPKLKPLLVILLIIVLAAQCYYIMTWKSESSRVNEQGLQLDQEINAIRDNGELKVKVDGYRQAEQLIAALMQNRTEWGPYLSAITKNMPATAKLVSLNAVDQKKITIDLDFKIYSDVVAYMRLLEAEEQLQQVILTSVFKKTDEQTTTEVVPSDIEGVSTTKTVRKEVYKLMLDIELSDDKGAS
ncbi:hypothetical protein BK133_28415 [Paenibacillus sp. FSL H8-0548]|uniref:hypothetical protein n=1 Tax=Paenibacillus sp. FSL H8-0548 TaxID=1920422 RepID=UPI00096E2C47|nr:hypothetical protein [Paenibacillus sp. FSL H8-0548]OMF21441.1 hypothetical protein BK133_28415 [Paenibacillus sp. FSL H8-0548]